MDDLGSFQANPQSSLSLYESLMNRSGRVGGWLFYDLGPITSKYDGFDALIEAWATIGMYTVQNPLEIWCVLTENYLQKDPLKKSKKPSPDNFPELWSQVMFSPYL